MAERLIAERLPEARDARGGRVQFPCFNGYHAIAAMAVLLFHAGFVGYTFRDHALGLAFFVCRLDIGVAIFFLVSAFLLYRPFVQAHFERRPPPELRAYFRNRILRIVPAYWAALTVMAFVFDAAPGVKSASGIPIFYGFAQIYFPGRQLQGIGQAWSLATEVSFYAFLPLYAWVLGRRPRSARRQLRVELAGVLVLYVGSFVFRLYAETFLPHRTETRFWLLSTSDLFALGILIAVSSAWFARRGSQPRMAAHRAFPAASWLLAAFAFWVVAIPLDLGRYPFEGISFNQALARQTLYGIVAFFLLLPGVFGPQDRGRIRGLLQSRTAQLVGLVSYGIFLWNVFVVQHFIDWFDLTVKRADGWVRTSDGDIIPFPLVLVVVIAVTLAIATVSYVAVERPFLRLKRHPRAAPAVSPPDRAA